MQQELELLREERVVVAQVVAEERKRLDEGAAADHDLGASAGEEVDGRELLEDADRVVGAQYGDGARQPDARCPGGRGREHDRGRRDRELGPVVLTHSEDVEADLVGELDLLDELAQAAGGVAPSSRPTSANVNTPISTRRF